MLETFLIAVSLCYDDSTINIVASTSLFLLLPLQLLFSIRRKGPGIYMPRCQVIYSVGNVQLHGHKGDILQCKIQMNIVTTQTAYTLK